MTEPAAKQWYIARDGKQTGPISDVEINTIAGMGYFRETDLVWRPGMAEWQPALGAFPPARPAPVPEPARAAPPMAEPQRTPAPPAGYDTTRPSQQPRPRAPEAFQPAPQPARSLPLETPAAQRSGAEQNNLRGAEQNNPRTAPPVDQRLQRDPRREWENSAARTAPSRPYPQTTPSWPSPETAPAWPAPDQAPSRPNFEPPATRLTSPPSQRPAPQPARGSVRPPRASNRGPILILTALVVAVTGGVWALAHPDLRTLVTTRAGTLFASLTQPKLLADGPAAPQPAQPAAAEPSGVQLAAIDDRLQQSAHWPVLKRVFPDWYGDRLREVAKLTFERRSDEDITKALVDQIVALRRQNVSQALSASGPRLKAMAAAFLENLKQLKAQSTTTCYNFISRGETTPGVINMLQAASGTHPQLQLQVAAIFEAINEGRATPVTHQRPQKTDFDVLMEQLAKLGWTQADVAVFADPDKLAKAEPERVCQMVQDWFVAHIAIPDAGVQERLLSETLRPVVAG